MGTSGRWEPRSLRTRSQFAREGRTRTNHRAPTAHCMDRAGTGAQSASNPEIPLFGSARWQDPLASQDPCIGRLRNAAPSQSESIRPSNSYLARDVAMATLLATSDSRAPDVRSFDSHDGNLVLALVPNLRIQFLGDSVRFGSRKETRLSRCRSEGLEVAQ